MFDKAMDLKNIRYKEFAEKYFGGILKKKLKYIFIVEIILGIIEHCLGIILKSEILIA